MSPTPPSQEHLAVTGNSTLAVYSGRDWRSHGGCRGYSEFVGGHQRHRSQRPSRSRDSTLAGILGVTGIITGAAVLWNSLESWRHRSQGHPRTSGQLDTCRRTLGVTRAHHSHRGAHGLFKATFEVPGGHQRHCARTPSTSPWAARHLLQAHWV
jgi:hypothetical protein